MLVIGSTALKHHIPTYRVPTDRDFICTYDEFQTAINYFKEIEALKAVYPVSGKNMVVKLQMAGIFEYTIAYKGTTDAWLLDYCKGRYHAPLNVLLMLKLSHRYKKNSPHFLKTMRDIQYLRSLGITLNDELKEVLKLREKETYTNKLPNLMQGKETFFQKTEDFYIWDHDDIHKAVAFPHQPAYLSFKPENSEVMVSKKMWDACSLDTQLRAGLEEAYVLALERSIVPHPGVLTPKQAFDKALEKVCTSITSGWFREFCWENYDAIQALYDEKFVESFEAARDSGKIKPFKK